MTLVWSDYTPADADTRKRHAAAMATWKASGMRLLPFVSEQNSRQIGDPHALPFVKDLFEYGFQDDEEVVVVSNNDIRLGPGAKDAIKSSCDKFGCFWTQRLDDNNRTDGGCDTFAVTGWWWRLNEETYPDLLLGARAWDHILKELMIASGCPEGPRVCFHTPHQNDHRQRLHTPGARYNEHLLSEWNKRKVA